MKGVFESLMLRTVLGPLLLALRIFAVYVVFHGHYSPGGGFQGGILLGTSFILPRLAGGPRPRDRASTGRLALGIAAGGTFLFALVGAAALLSGGAFLDYAALALPVEDPLRRSLGILAVELGVAIAVAGVAVSLFDTLRGREVAA